MLEFCFKQNNLRTHTRNATEKFMRQTEEILFALFISNATISSPSKKWLIKAAVYNMHMYMCIHRKRHGKMGEREKEREISLVKVLFFFEKDWKRLMAR